MLIEYFIGAWLIIGALFDKKFYKVPNFISYSIIILSIPLLILNHVWTQSTPILLFKLFVILYLFVAWWFSDWVSTKTTSDIFRWGAADTKVMTPIILMLPEMKFVIFISLMPIAGIVIGLYLLIKKRQKKTPAFIPIIIAYWVAIIL